MTGWNFLIFVSAIEKPSIQIRLLLTLNDGRRGGEMNSAPNPGLNRETCNPNLGKDKKYIQELLDQYPKSQMRQDKQPVSNITRRGIVLMGINLKATICLMFSFSPIHTVYGT